ncbi:unnamed protein product [Pleuronectes platessa]|uniref:Uncharacterized protein n=1 Tax=Pleuronectes platessa TaxID=8262 RepID=A0A9N7VCT0_PLEPL|nr:unnamed protein product [Pleuronectes platessa]
MDNKSKKRSGGAEKHREKKLKSLWVEAAKCAKLTDLFGAGFTSPAAGAPGDERGGLDHDERVEADMVDHLTCESLRSCSPSVHVRGLALCLPPLSAFTVDHLTCESRRSCFPDTDAISFSPVLPLLFLSPPSTFILLIPLFTDLWRCFICNTIPRSAGVVCALNWRHHPARDKEERDGGERAVKKPMFLLLSPPPSLALPLINREVQHLPFSQLHPSFCLPPPYLTGSLFECTSSDIHHRASLHSNLPGAHGSKQPVSAPLDGSCQQKPSWELGNGTALGRPSCHNCAFPHNWLVSQGTGACHRAGRLRLQHLPPAGMGTFRGVTLATAPAGKLSNAQLHKPTWGAPGWCGWNPGALPGLSSTQEQQPSGYDSDLNPAHFIRNELHCCGKHTHLLSCHRALDGYLSGAVV